MEIDMTGFDSKQQMAADKFCDANCVWTDHHPDCNMAADKLQEPPSEWTGIKAILDEYGLQAIDFVADFKEALAQPPLLVQEPVREALKLALEALKEAQTNDDGMEKWDRNKKAITAIKEALAQPAQEPVARVTGVYGGRFTYEPINPAMLLPVGMALYPAPPLPAQEQWNAALDEAAARINEIKGFGQATQDSFAVYIKGLKK